jgi:hypothetical protein
LVGHHQRVSSQGSSRVESGAPRNNNSNTEFLMNLMRGPDRSDSGMMRAVQQAQNQGPPPSDDFSRDSRNAQRQMRPGPPPGFAMDDGGDFMPNPNQGAPTQILQRPPPPPGLEQMPPNWMAGRGQMPPPPPPPQQVPQPQQVQPQGQHHQQRGPMLPPPGLVGRNPPPGMPPMFAPNFPHGGMPHPDAMGPPPRNMGPPPPGFFGQMPPNFMPPGMAGFGGPSGPESPGAFGPGSPFEARGMMPPGGRGANFGRG